MASKLEGLNVMQEPGHYSDWDIVKMVGLFESCSITKGMDLQTYMLHRDKATILSAMVNLERQGYSS